MHRANLPSASCHAEDVYPICQDNLSSNKAWAEAFQHTHTHTHTRCETEMQAVSFNFTPELKVIICFLTELSDFPLHFARFLHHILDPFHSSSGRSSGILHKFRLLMEL